jgi:hypothetical protein
MNRRKRSIRSSIRRKSWPESYGIAIERPRGLHRFTGTLRSCRGKNRLGGRRVFRRNAAHCQHQQSPGGSAAAWCRARARKHGPSGDGWANRDFARQSRRKYCHDVTQPKSGRWNRVNSFESRYRSERRSSRCDSGERRHPLRPSHRTLGCSGRCLLANGIAGMRAT